MLSFTIPGEPREAERWKDVEGYEGLYQISTFGRVKSLQNGGLILKPYSTGQAGHLTVKFRKKNIKVHRLVAYAFLPKEAGKDHVNHIDGDKRNNHVSNLEWCTPKENRVHAAVNGLSQSGSRVACSKLNELDVKEIRSTYQKGSPVFGAKPLARRYGVSDPTIRNIVAGKKWKGFL